ncbi:MAG: GNAT family N-acetyltransferase [Clostridia bacterium]|nr:GNAT family N-acetyltransferase [Clostridia bacterium]
MMKACAYIPELETPRLILRRLTASDAEDLREWLGLDEVYTYWGRPASKEDKNPELMFIDPRPQVVRRPSHSFIWGMELKDTRKVIGIMEVFEVDTDRIGKVGYRVDPRRWNCGLCTEALQRVVEFIFSETKFDRLETTVNVKNPASSRVLEKSGFRLEGTIRHGKMGIRYCDYHIWGLIRDDLTEQAPMQGKE